MSEIATSIGAQIRQLRQQRALSQESLAYKAGLNTSYLGQVERGEKSPTVDTLAKIATALDVNLEKLFIIDNIDSKDEFPVIEKIIYELKGRSQFEQEAAYDFIKRLLHFRDKK